MRALAKWVARVGGVLIALAHLGADGAEGQAKAAQIFGAMLTAAQQLNYQGTVVIYKNDNLESLKFTHVVNASGDTQEHAVALNSPLREVIRTSSKAICIYAEAQAMIVDHAPLQRSLLVDFPPSAEVLEQDYSYEMQGEETIALQSTDIILLKPNDDYRYARRFWIAQDHHLPLKYVLLDADGKVLEQVAFTDLQVKPSLASSFIDLEKYQNAHLNVQHVHELQPLPSEAADFTLQNLPHGFASTFFTRRKMHGSDEPVAHMVLKDGLASISVYVERQPKPQPKVIKAAGAISSFSLQNGDRLVTVMGDVPLKTVQYIAEGIRFKESRP